MSVSRAVVHLVRHGRVASHRGDVPVTPEGLAEVEVAGQRLADSISPGETIHILHTSTARARETALPLHRILRDALGSSDSKFLAPREEWAIRNPDLFLAGRRVEMVSTAETMAHQLPDIDVDATRIDRLPFYHEFFRHPDRIGFWLRDPNPPGEDAHAVARRTMTWAASLIEQTHERVQRYICVTHSPVMRAVLLRYLLATDPGEPEWVESIDITVERAGIVIAYRDQRATVAAP